MSSAPVQLRVVFGTAEAFRLEFEKNISSGGMFIPRRQPLPLRAPVEVDMSFPFQGERVVLPAEVVHSVPPELAASGATPGVAVQFLVSANELRSGLARFLDRVDVPRPEPGSRRRAARATARLPARVHGRSGSVAARTRDISASGVLMSVPTDEIEVGDPVQVALTHPRTGKEMGLRGRVVRQVESEGGGVAAVAVEFEAAEDERARIETFVSELATAEHSRRLGGIAGSLSPLGLDQVIRMLAAAPQGTLTVIRGSEEGHLGFEGGLLLGARLGPTSGTKALARVLGWTEGRFEFHARVEEADFEGPPQRLDEALEAAAQARHALNRRRPRAYPKRSVFQVDEVALAGESLEKLEASVVDLARVGMTVRKILDVVPEPDAAILLAFDSLVERGILSLS